MTIRVDLLELLSPQWATKHPLARCPIAAGPTPTTHYQPDWQIFWWRRSCRGLSRCPCSLPWPLCHLCHPKNNVFMTLLQRNQYLPPKTNDKNQSTGATTTAQFPTTPSSPHSGKPWRGAALTYPNAPYFVVGGGWGDTHQDTQCSCPMVRKQGTNRVMRCWWYTGFLTLPLLNMEKEEHSWNHLDNLSSLKARRIGRGEDIIWLDGLKHFGETRD